MAPGRHPAAPANPGQPRADPVARNSLMRPNMSWATEQRREQAVQRVMNASAAKQPRRDVTTVRRGAAGEVGWLLHAGAGWWRAGLSKPQFPPTLKGCAQHTQPPFTSPHLPLEPSLLQDDIVKGRTMGKQDVSKPSGTPSHPAGKPSGGGKGSRGGRGKPSGGGLFP